MPFGGTLVDDPNGNSWDQPYFDSRISTLQMLQKDPWAITKTGHIQHGYIKSVADLSIYNGSRPSGSTLGRRLTFLYNPSSVNVSHVISTSDAALDPSLRYNIDDGSIFGPTGATVNFSLLFDRTYEVSNPENFGKPLGERGVQADIDALYAIVGILDIQNLTTTPPVSTLTPNQTKADAILQGVVTSANVNGPNGPYGKPGNLTAKEILLAKDDGGDASLAAVTLISQLQAAGLTFADIPSFEFGTPADSGAAATTTTTQEYFGFMKQKNAIVVFGQQRNTWTPVLQYYGYINSINIEYAHWTQRMVPARCSVQIGFNVMAQTSALAAQLGVFQ